MDRLPLQSRMPKQGATADRDAIRQREGDLQVRTDSHINLMKWHFYEFMWRAKAHQDQGNYQTFIRSFGSDKRRCAFWRVIDTFYDWKECCRNR